MDHPPQKEYETEVVEYPWIPSTTKNRQQKKSLKSSPIAAPDKLSRLIAEQNPQTPFLAVDLDVIAANYRSLRTNLPKAEVFYAVKANPEPEVVRLLVGLGSSFDVASPAEIELVLGAGAEANQVSYGNTIKKERDIAFAYEQGVRLFAFDSEEELLKIARVAPRSKVFCRILTSNEGAEWPLSRKFGCEISMARDLLIKAQELGLEPHGVSFHVGSQQTRLDQWDTPLREASELFTSLKEAGITLSMVNIGGGLPAHYQNDIEPVEAYAAAISDAMTKSFRTEQPQMIIEPGRSLVGDSGTIETEIVLISKKSYTDDVRWVYLDIGKFGGLAETHDEAIKYRIEVIGRSGPTAPVILAGPSCDSVDILYEKFQYQLPLSMRVGDRIRIHATGAYTSSYSSVGFNGFAPLPTYCI
ncbi:type III PLP-dependent enzyme [Candidatus Parcubacteria bacterium]|nr:type III PLP-dependent enzyme [Candidatus Parcubacteria bacterium]